MEFLYIFLWLIAGFSPWIIFAVWKLKQVTVKDLLFASAQSIFGPLIWAVILVIIFVAVVNGDKVLWKSN